MLPIMKAEQLLSLWLIIMSLSPILSPQKLNGVEMLHIIVWNIFCEGCGEWSGKDSYVSYVEDFEKIRKNDVTLRRDNTIFKVIIAPTLNEFCFRVKTIHLQDTTKSLITESKFR